MKQRAPGLDLHLKGYATTWCYIMRIACVGKYAGTIRGFTSLDESFVYNDGQGDLLYRADNGFMPAKFQRAADFSVGNTDLSGWVTDEVISDQDILAGIFNSAEVTIYRVNYMDLFEGHEVVDFGTLGETDLNGDSWKCEFRSLMQKAKQPFGEVYSLTCRNQYGDDLCGKQFEWFTFTIDAISDDPYRSFQATELTQDEGYFAPGVVEVITGANAGADMDVDGFFAGGLVTLALEMPMPFANGDQLRIRRDCDKRFETCQERDNYLEFNGEPKVPVADTGLSVPGAYVVQQGAT